MAAKLRLVAARRVAACDTITADPVTALELICNHATTPSRVFKRLAG
jgi:hypothetical protein